LLIQAAAGLLVLLTLLLFSAGLMAGMTPPLLKLLLTWLGCTENYEVQARALAYISAASD
jgi:hypothetical protein